jgi:uncharacterized damage-inducible protein DinB
VSAAIDGREALRADVDFETMLARRVLTRAPDASLAWRPHPRSLSLGALAWHLTEVVHWGAQMLDADHYDLARAAGDHPEPVVGTTSDILDRFDRRVDEWRESLACCADSALQQMWTLRRGDAIVFAVPRLTALRYLLLHHLVHHRGQLTVYLRLLDVPVPPLYGPSADEIL